MERSDWGGTADEVLAALRWNWGRGYKIDWKAGGLWTARRRDGRGGEITAANPAALREAILRDYERNPVRRCEGS
jgi:hypothetical protein